MFWDSKKFLSQGVCMIKFLFLEGIQGHISTIIHQCFTILSVSGIEVEIFFTCDFWKILDFVEVKNF